MKKLWYANVEHGNYILWVVERTKQAAIDALIAALDSDTTIGPLDEDEIAYYIENMSVYQIEVGEVQWD